MLLIIAELFNGITKIILAVIGSQTPEQQKEMWDRYLAQTKWMSDLLIKFSTDVEKLIERDK